MYLRLNLPVSKDIYKMERWSRKVAVVTGCSSGIGASIARHLCKKGMIVIGLARRVQRLESLSKEIGDEGGAFRFHECDVSNRLSVKNAFAWIAQNYPNVSVLVNNAGVNISTSILAEDNEALLESVVNTNLMGALYCTKEVYKIMKQANGDEFYIININSILGHNIFRASRDVRLNVYPSSKFGLRAASEVMRLELLGDKRFHISVSIRKKGSK